MFLLDVGCGVDCSSGGPTSPLKQHMRSGGVTYPSKKVTKILRGPTSGSLCKLRVLTVLSMIARLLTTEQGCALDSDGPLFYSTGQEPPICRHLLADHAIRATPLLQYRRGVFGHGLRHSCSLVNLPFRRGDEECSCFDTLTYLSVPRPKAKRQLEKQLWEEEKFTVLDYWFALKDLGHVLQILRIVDQAWRRRYSSAYFDTSVAV